MNNKIITIIGPTASGKSNLAINLAKELNKEIISADSRQVYKYLDIGTAKPSQEELNNVKHHLVDKLNPDEDFNAGMFAETTLELVEKRKDNLPIICGGTGFYIKAFFEGIFNEEEKIPQEIREKLNLEYKKYGIDRLYSELLEVDQISSNKNKDKNPQRIIRALEYYRFHKIPISKAHQNQSGKNHEYKPIYFAIDIDRESLYEKINYRTEQMWKRGLVDETKKILDMGYSKNLNSLNTVGYKETIEYLESKISEEEAISEIKKNTRRYAKRQVTWNRKIKDINYINSSDKNHLQNIIKKINQNE